MTWGGVEELEARGSVGGRRVSGMGRGRRASEKGGIQELVSDMGGQES